jgi:two-component system, OmpR family, alkaline phosphatase synthesis response regulator PhoP
VEQELGPGTILIVDDEQSVCISLEGVLAREGYRTFSANDGRAAIEILSSQNVDLVLVDLNMPRMSGLELVQIIRERWPRTVTTILTGYGTLESAIVALRNGAHDYLLKPSTPEDIKASVRKGLDKRRTIQRRRQLLTDIEASVRALTHEHPDAPSNARLTESKPQQQTILHTDHLVIDLKQHRVTIDQKEISLTPIEFSTLVVLVRNRGRVLSYASIVQDTHGYNCSEQEARTLIKTHISHLRQKIARQTNQPCPIANVRGVGYMWPEEA